MDPEEEFDESLIEDESLLDGGLDDDTDADEESLEAHGFHEEDEPETDF